jgi:FkbM family methyltransferase
MQEPQPEVVREETELADSTGARESRLVWDYFKRQAHGRFVDVGANHPTERNQTWFLERQGWSGLLVEPHPEMCKLLRAHRRGSRTVEAAVCGPGQEGEAELQLAVDPAKSSLQPEWDHALTGQKIRVPARTLNSILAEDGIGRIDFLSLDVEGMELPALRGLDLGRYQPQLILIEDHFYGLEKHCYLRRHGYKLVRRTGYNNWYAPRSAPVSVFSMSSLPELVRLGRKMWLNMPFNRLRRRLKQRKRARTAAGY